MSAIMPWVRGCFKSRDRNTRTKSKQYGDLSLFAKHFGLLAGAFARSWLVFQSTKHAKRPLVLSKRYGLSRREVVSQKDPEVTVRNLIMGKR